MKYWFAAAVGAILGLSGCMWNKTDDIEAAYYPVQGINAYKGQSAASVFDDNGAPNVTKDLGNGMVMWIYYTNYQTVGGSEIISYDIPGNGNGMNSCSVSVILNNGVVDSVMSDCR